MKNQRKWEKKVIDIVITTLIIQMAFTDKNPKSQTSILFTSADYYVQTRSYTALLCLVSVAVTHRSFIKIRQRKATTLITSCVQWSHIVLARFSRWQVNVLYEVSREILTAWAQTLSLRNSQCDLGVGQYLLAAQTSCQKHNIFILALLNNGQPGIQSVAFSSKCPCAQSKWRSLSVSES